MSFKVMPKAALSEWIERLCTDYRVIGPTPSQDHYVFAEVQSATRLELDYPTSILPPKKILLPQREVMIRFDTSNGGHIEPLVDDQPTIILGIHACDMHAIMLLDRVFNRGFTDQHYLTRRENTILVSIECLRPCSEHSFCKSMNTLSVPNNFDLHLTDLGDAYAIDIGSEKGAVLLEGFPAVSDASDKDYRRVHQVISDKWPRFPYRLDFDVSELPSGLAVLYRSVFWDELGERCLGCGMCNAVCPTCHCFNMLDEVDFNLTTGRRIRVWDSCQLDEFATVAGGHSFRDSRAARLRHRFFHKGKYESDASGLVGCVGCGRCVQACLVHISPVNVFNELYRRRVANTRRKQGTAS